VPLSVMLVIVSGVSSAPSWSRSSATGRGTPAIHMQR
jgi:hypothetical protein